MNIYKKFPSDAKRLRKKTIIPPIVVASPQRGRGNPGYKINLKLTYSLINIFLLCVMNAHADLNTEIQYGRAMQEAQQGNWESAHARLNQLVTDNPERADILYDSGVAAYRLKNFESAQAYFKHAIQSADLSADLSAIAKDDLKERAHFNLGNTYVATKQLQQAIDEYEKVLDINPENKPAQDNLRIVKQMLEQEKQKQKEQDKQQQKNQQKQEQQQKQDQEQKDQQQKDKESGGKNDKKDKDSQGQNDQQEKDQNQQDEQNGDQSGEKDGQKDQQQKQEKQNQDQQNKSDQNKSGQQDQSEKEKSDKGQEQSDQGQQANDNAGGDQEKKDGEKKDQSEQSEQGNKEDHERKGDKKPQRGLDNKQSEQEHDGKKHDEHGAEPSKEMSEKQPEKQLDAAHGTQDQQKNKEPIRDKQVLNPAPLKNKRKKRWIHMNVGLREL